MMAASVYGVGRAGRSLESSPAVSRKNSPSLHDPSITPSSSSVINNSANHLCTDVKSENSTFIEDEIFSLSSSGKQLALSSCQGREASPAPSSVCDLHEDETDIALSQLRELDIAIEVRKVTKVDGRKTRWVEFRKRKERSSDGTFMKEDIKDDSFESEGQEEERGRKRTVRSRKSTTGDKDKEKEEVAKEILDINENSSPVKTEIVDNSDTNNLSLNNNRRFENNNIELSKMRPESTPVVVVATPPAKASNVLETMKQQFLQGTVNIPDIPSPINGAKQKRKTLRTRTVNGSAATNENSKKRLGRPKKSNGIKNPTKSSSPIIKAEDKHLPEFPHPELVSASSTPNINGVAKVETVKKEPLHQSISQNPSEFYSKKNFLTKGLREIRKSESSSESGSSSPDKTGTPTSTAPSTPLPVSPISTPLTGERNVTKCPLISAAAKAFSSGNKKGVNTFANRKTKSGKRLAKKENIDFNVNKSSITTIDKMFKRSQVLTPESDNKEKEDNSIAKRKTRGRPKTKDGCEEKNGKNTATVIVDVHNTMNGEPQTVIPPANSLLTRKKKSPKISVEDDSNNVSKPLVPATKDISQLNNSKTSINNTPSASKIPNDKLNDSVSTNNKSESEGMKPLKNTVSINSNQKIAPLNSSNNNTVCPNDSPSSQSKTPPTTPYRSIAMKTPTQKLSPGTIIVTTAEAIKKNASKTPTDIIKQAIGSTENPSNTNTLTESINNDNVNAVEGEKKSPVEEAKKIAVKTSESGPTLKETSQHILDNFSQKQKESEARTDSLKPFSKSPDSSEVLVIKKTIETKNKGSEIATKDDKLQTSDSNKKPRPPPRYLKNLFQDEGVQNMLKSVHEETPSSIDGSNVGESGVHKLRPKRTSDNLVSESPEPEEISYLPNAKRKKRGTEVDKLFLDEGTLNLLTSLDSNSRRQVMDDASSDTSQSSGSKAPKKIDNTDTESIRKRRASGSSNASSTGTRNAQQPEIKKSKTEPIKTELSSSAGPNVNRPTQVQEVKKIGKPLTVTMKPKNKLQLQLQMKRQLQRMGVKSNNLNMGQMKEILLKASRNPSTSSSSPSFNQSVPPLKIRIAQPEKTTATPAVVKTSVQDGQQQKVTRMVVPSSSRPPLLHSSSQKKLINQNRNLPPIMSLMRPLDSSGSSNGSKGNRIRPMSEGVRQSQRASVRQNDGNNQYRDISLRKFNNFVHVILTPSTTKMKNSFNSRVLKELCDVLNVLKKDDSVRMVLLTGTGSTFCQGIDLTALQHPNQETRKKNAESLAKGIREFLRALVLFPKIIVAGVNGDAMGLGVTMLPLFDSVIASDKAEFFLPYSKLGQVPEGGATYTFPFNYGKIPSCRLFCGNKITAIQAQQMGIVSESIWPATFHAELIPKVALQAANPTQGLEATKALMNHHLVTKLELSVESENRLLVQHWTSATFFHACKRFLDHNNIAMQKPLNLPPY